MPNSITARDPERGQRIGFADRFGYREAADAGHRCNRRAARRDEQRRDEPPRESSVSRTRSRSAPVRRSRRSRVSGNAIAVMVPPRDGRGRCAAVPLSARRGGAAQIAPARRSQRPATARWARAIPRLGWDWLTAASSASSAGFEREDRGDDADRVVEARAHRALGPARGTRAAATTSSASSEPRARRARARPSPRRAPRTRARRRPSRAARAPARPQPSGTNKPMPQSIAKQTAAAEHGREQRLLGEQQRRRETSPRRSRSSVFSSRSSASIPEASRTQTNISETADGDRDRVVVERRAAAAEDLLRARRSAPRRRRSPASSRRGW